MRKLLSALTILALLGMSAGHDSAAAQESVDPQWAQQFVGSWDVTLTGPDGAVPLVVNVREQAGSVVVVLGNGDGEGDPITDLRRIDDALVASYDMDYGGMAIDAVLRMERAGEQLDTDWSFASGAYETSAMGNRR